MEFSGQDDPVFRGTKTGSIYLTTHRMIFLAKKLEDAMKSFSFPFICLTDVEVEQPLFGANYIRGKVRAQENGNFVGEAKFKLLFKSGGAIDFAQAMLRAAHMAKQNAHNAAPPPYTPPSGKFVKIKNTTQKATIMFSFVLFFRCLVRGTATGLYTKPGILWLVTKCCFSE